MASLPAWALSHLERNLPAGNMVVNARAVRRNLVLANTRLGAVLVSRSFWGGIRHVFLEVPAQKTAFRCAACREELQFYGLEIPSDVYCSLCASRYHVDEDGNVTDHRGDPVASEFKPKEIDPFPPVPEAPAPFAPPAEGKAPKARKNGVAFRHNGYTLFAKRMETRGGGRMFYFFARGTPKAGEPAPLPDGYTVGVNGRTGLPFLRRKGEEDPVPEVRRPPRRKATRKRRSS